MIPLYEITGTKQMHGRYVGRVRYLYGKTALLLHEPERTTVRAQFDDLSLPYDDTHGWQTFDLTEFELDMRE